MYTTIYRPKTIQKFIGNKQIILSFTKWLLEWDGKNKKNKCALISGISGIGKSLLVELVLYIYDHNIIHLNSEDSCNKNYLDTYIKPTIKTKRTINDQYNAIVISDIDTISDYGFISNITDIIKESEIPIVCICDDRYSQTIKPILNYCIDFKMSKPTYDEVYPLIYKIVNKENIKIKESQIKQLYEQSNGDIRFMLNSLQLNLFNKYNSSNIKNIQTSNIFETTGKLFSMDLTFEKKNEIYWSANDIHTLMVQENYINNIIGINNDINKLEKLSYSADSLSDADLFDTGECDWDLTPYIALNTICATSNCNKKSMIKFPQYLGKIATQNKNKREKIDYNKIKFFKNEENNVEPIQPKKEIKKSVNKSTESKKKKVNNKN